MSTLNVEPSVKILRFPLSAEIWIHCVMSGETQRHVLPRQQSEVIKILNISLGCVEWVGIEPTTSRIIVFNFIFLHM